jgi:hypothetical protein
MKRYPLIIILMPALILALGCQPGASLPISASQALTDSASFELLSLNPDSRDKHADGAGFQGWSVLGETTIADPVSRAKLIDAFEKGVKQHDGGIAACFNPRHGIRVVSDSETHEFVICFECSQVRWYIDGQRADSTILISESPQRVFDAVLKDANVPLAEKKRK